MYPVLYTTLTLTSGYAQITDEQRHIEEIMNRGVKVDSAYGPRNYSAQGVEVEDPVYAPQYYPHKSDWERYQEKLAGEGDRLVDGVWAQGVEVEDPVYAPQYYPHKSDWERYQEKLAGEGDRLVDGVWAQGVDVEEAHSPQKDVLAQDLLKALIHQYTMNELPATNIEPQGIEAEDSMIGGSEVDLSEFDLDSWKSALKQEQDDRHHYSELISDPVVGDHPAQAYEEQSVSVPTPENDIPWPTDPDSPINLYRLRCERQKPKEMKDLAAIAALSKSEHVDYMVNLGSYNNCMFGLSWAKQYIDNKDSEDVIKSEYDYASAIWGKKFGMWWRACYPLDKYAKGGKNNGPMWPGVDGSAPTGADGGLAICDSSSGHITGCRCFDLPPGAVTPEDANLVIKGNCDEPGQDPHTCLAGAKKILEQRKWKPEMRWFGILQSLSEILDQFQDSIHLGVTDVYFIHRYWPELLEEDCTSCQFYAARRPMPYIKGIDYQEAAEEMDKLATN